MPFVSNRGQRIHYSVEGAGPLVILQHGLFDDARGWKQYGYVDALSDRYRVACVDSLGHGQSDKPVGAELYAQAQRAADLAAVIDDLGEARAHVVGYSMGGWIAVGMAKYFPERLASLVIGGWDPVGGMETARLAFRLPAFPFEALLSTAHTNTPEILENVTPEALPGLRASFEQLSDLGGAAEAVVGAGVPVLFWAGRRDPYYEAMRRFATINGFAWLPTSGDHLGARKRAPESPPGLRRFLDQVEARRGARIRKSIKQ